ncbi:MAG: proteasome subunit beta [Nanoarchaeota archaeon]|nr:proteasome subunit beta [Nanoarchaeota archaeon]
MDSELKNSILKTGTSLVGIVCKDGVVLAADRKMTLGGQIVAHKNFPKIYKINDYLLVSIAGQVSDAQMALKIIAAQLKLKELKSKKRPTIREAASFISSFYFHNIRQPAMIPAIVASLVAGVNEDGTAELYNISPDGAIKDIQNYDADGSGMMFIWGLLERQYKKDLTIKEGVNLAMESIKSSSERDVASGSGIDVYTLTKEGINHVIDQQIFPDFRNRE